MVSQIIDCHAHYLPFDLSDEFNKHVDLGRKIFKLLHPKKVRNFKMKQDGAPGKKKEEGYFGKAWHDIDCRLEWMNDLGIDKQILSASTLMHFPFQNEFKIIDKVNRSIGKIALEKPDKFMALIHVNPYTGSNSAEYIKDIMGQYPFVGVTVKSSHEGRFLDHKNCDSLFALLSEKKMPLFLHPTFKPSSVTKNAYSGIYGLVAMSGFVIDTSTSALRMILSGVFDRYPDLKVLIPHSGGILPFIIGRVNELSRSHAFLQKMKHEPGYYLEKIFLDCNAYNAQTIRCALSTVGGNNLVFGSDYPAVGTDAVKLVKKSLSELDLDEETGNGVYRNNALSLIK
jgi:predicted TIM-barrel fold metal-dependent hydrolase